MDDQAPMKDDNTKDDKTKDKAKEDGGTKLPSLGIAESAGHKGTVSVNDNAPIESLVLAYQAVGKIADSICASVAARSTGPILIHNPADFVALGEFRAFEQQAEFFERLLSQLTDAVRKLGAETVFGGREANLIAETAAVVIGAIGSAINSGLQILSLFRADNEIKNFKIEIEIEEQVLAMTVAGRLAAKNLPVFNSALVPIEPPAKSAAVDRLMRLKAQCLRLSEALNDKSGKAEPRAEKDKATHEPDAEGRTYDQGLPIGLAEASGEVIKQSSSEAELRAGVAEAIKNCEAFLNGLVKLDEKTGTSKLSQVLLGENVHALLHQRACVLWLKPVAAGGSAHAKTSTFNSALSYSGGAIASYAIFDHQGRLIEADTVPMFGGKVNIENLPWADWRPFGAKYHDPEVGARERPWPAG
jgi:hypothetical protein